MTDHELNDAVKIVLREYPEPVTRNEERFSPATDWSQAMKAATIVFANRTLSVAGNTLLCWLNLAPEKQDAAAICRLILVVQKKHTEGAIVGSTVTPQKWNGFEPVEPSISSMHIDNRIREIVREEIDTYHKRNHMSPRQVVDLERLNAEQSRRNFEAQMAANVGNPPLTIDEYRQIAQPQIIEPLPTGSGAAAAMEWRDRVQREVDTMVANLQKQDAEPVIAMSPELHQEYKDALDKPADPIANFFTNPAEE